MTLLQDTMQLSRALIEVEQAKQQGKKKEEEEALERMIDVIQNKPNLWGIVYDSLMQQKDK